MTTLRVAFCCFLALAGTADAMPKKSETDTVSGQAAVVANLVRIVMDNKLKDYPSARFRDVKFSIMPDGSGGVACGYVNSKNSSGGYVGWVPFWVLAGNPVSASVALVGDDDVTASGINATCSDATTKWLPRDYSVQISPKQ